MVAVPCGVSGPTGSPVGLSKVDGICQRFPLLSVGVVELAKFAVAGFGSEPAVGSETGPAAVESVVDGSGGGAGDGWFG